MKTFNPLPKAEMARRNQLLQQASTALKSHFVGIDAQIDQLIEHIRPWYLLPGQQDRPRIVNLWGMTGVGKTALVLQLVHYLELERRYYPIDFGNSQWNANGLIDAIENAHRDEPAPAIFMLDEFQKARTLDKEGEEVETSNRYLWNLLDSGQILYAERDSDLRYLRDYYKDLELCLALGVVVEKGKVTEGENIYREVFEINENRRRHAFLMEDNDDFFFFLKERVIDVMCEHAQSIFESRLALRQRLLQLDGPGSLHLIEKVIELMMLPKIFDCSQDLIFVAGNLDSAYNFTHHTDPEIEADTVKSLNAEVGLTSIKRALLERFRPEQVARLGNNHVIYPAFSNEAFTEIIRRGLARLSERFEANTGVELLFEPSVHKLVYKEGVFPSQGTRPLFSTLENLAGSRLANWQLALHELETPCQQIHVAQIGDKLVARFLAKQGGCLCEKSHELHLPLKKARKPKRDDKQALVAVHEAGHAVLSCALLGRVPAKIVSQSTDDSTDGFVVTDQRHDIVSKHYLLRMTAVFLGGLAAETLLFGEEHITLGSASDLREATRWLSKAYRKSGFTGVWAAYGPDGLNKPLLTLHEPQLEQAIHDTLAEARQLAFDTLQFEKGFLIALAGELANQQQMRRPQIERLRKVHMLGSMQSPLLNYRSHLLQMRQQQHLGQVQEAGTKLVLL
ncbi:MAG: hypothetical protein Q8J69_07560 [Sphingobacteriaceae bacterium]|nr:hypothetical protein [Sphingobacteriaceae bacterium]